MSEAEHPVVALEHRFWQSMVDGDAAVALTLLAEPAAMVSEHGAMQFDHDRYRRMAEQGPKVLRSFTLTDIQVMTPRPDVALLLYRVKQKVASRAGGDEVTQEMQDTSTWIQIGGEWRCVMHTETPLPAGN